MIDNFLSPKKSSRQKYGQTILAGTPGNNNNLNAIIVVRIQNNISYVSYLTHCPAVEEMA